MDTSNLVRRAESTIAQQPSYRSIASDEIELTATTGEEGPALAGSDIIDRELEERRQRKRGCYGLAFEWFENRSPAWTMRRFLSHVLPMLMILGLLTLLLIMSLPGFLFANSGGVCKPDADFQLSFASYSPWKRDAIFAINLSFGSYSFGVAKLIDVSWDVVRP